jgi:acyl-CoA thioester hydrolase
MSGAVEVWRGGVNTWECDEMGHLNVRHWLVKAMEGLAGLAGELGMPGAFRPDAGATLLLREHHIRFLREARPGAPLHLTGGVTSFDEHSAWLLLEVIHSATGEPAATLHTRVEHAEPRSGRPFPWPRRVRECSEALRIEAPDYAQPRSISLEPVQAQASVARAEALGLRHTGRGVIDGGQVDVFGRMRAEQFIGRVSDGVTGLVRPIREAIEQAGAEAEGPRPRLGGAVLEYRMLYLDWPRAGDHVALRSGLAGVDGRTQRLMHWLLDPVSGAAWGTSEAVAINLDLDTRKIAPISEAVQAALRPLIVEGLTL